MNYPLRFEMRSVSNVLMKNLFSFLYGLICHVFLMFSRENYELPFTVRNAVCF